MLSLRRFFNPRFIPTLRYRKPVKSYEYNGRFAYPVTNLQRYAHNTNSVYNSTYNSIYNPIYNPIYTCSSFFPYTKFFQVNNSKLSRSITGYDYSKFGEMNAKFDYGKFI